MMNKIAYHILFGIGLILFTPEVLAQTVALWTFDEPVGLYPSSVLSDQSDNDYPLILGQAGRIVEGKFGNALEPCEIPDIPYPDGEARFGLRQIPVPDGRTMEPMSWMNAGFSALMTHGEAHLRRQVSVPHPSQMEFNLGAEDWTVECWYRQQGAEASQDAEAYGVLFELGTGPRGENDLITALRLHPGSGIFTLVNGGGGNFLEIPTHIEKGKWVHLAFCYESGEDQLRHYVNGKLQPLPAEFDMEPLSRGEEDYMSIGRDGRWQHALAGSLDELHFMKGLAYRSEFTPPGSHMASRQVEIAGKRPESAGALLFAGSSGKSEDEIVALGRRKHLFVDDAMVEDMEDCRFVVNPPRPAEVVVADIQGTFRKHLSIVEDEQGVIRMYYGGKDDCLEVLTSKDGIHFTAPDLGRGEIHGKKNVVVEDPSAMGNVFIDPKAPAGDRWRFISDYNRRGIYLFSSADGYHFTRMRTSILPFRSGSQSNTFYDEQQDKYISYHRCDFTKTEQGATRRTFVYTETDVVDRPWPFRHASLEDYESMKGKLNMRSPIPWYMDNGPLTPGGFSIEYPTVFSEIDTLDPPESDIYVPKAIKYPWAPDTYLAFPLLYFHYEQGGTVLRGIHFDPAREKGSGPIETQFSVSRDALNWKRYPRPAYVGIGDHRGSDIKQAYLAHGMVRRGDEIWQYCFGETRYHSSRQKSPFKREVYRLVQRLDGFVSIDSPYEKEALLRTKPFRFEGKHLHLNLDTDAAGYVQVGILDGEGNPIPGFGMDECIYLNGDFTDTRVEWLQNAEELAEIEIGDEEDYERFSGIARTTMDLSPLEGQTVQLEFRMRGAKLYTMQFRED